LVGGEQLPRAEHDDEDHDLQHRDQQPPGGQAAPAAPPSTRDRRRGGCLLAGGLGGAGAGGHGPYLHHSRPSTTRSITVGGLLSSAARRVAPMAPGSVTRIAGTPKPSASDTKSMSGSVRSAPTNRWSAASGSRAFSVFCFSVRYAWLSSTTHT